MASAYRRISARLAVGLAATAFPLVGAGAAQAVLAGGTPFTSTHRPDLVSATITGSSSARFCFDKVVTAVDDVSGFYLGGYRADVTSKSRNATASGNCVNAQISTSPWFTFAQVGGSAVRTTGNSFNLGDSVALSGSNTANGTRGMTVAPDLQGVSLVSGAPQEIAFTYDEPVSSIVGLGGFHFVTSGAIPGCPAPATPACDIHSDAASISATDPATVIAAFPVGGVPIVTSAVRAYSVPGAVNSAIDGAPGGYDSEPVPGSAGVVTGVPTLISAQYSLQPGVAAGALFLGSHACGTVGGNDCVAVDYTFSENVSVDNSGSSLGNFLAYLSDGTSSSASALTEPAGCGGATTANPPCAAGRPTPGAFYGSSKVRAFFTFPGDARPYDDYLVKAAVNGGQSTAELAQVSAGGLNGCNGITPNCAVVSTATGHPNTVGEQPIGGNSGGKGSGYSTAPDPLFATFDTRSNTAAVTFDSRVFSIPDIGAAVSPSNFELLGADGSEIAGATAISTCPPSTPGFPCGPLASSPGTAGGPRRLTVWVAFPSPSAQVGEGKGLEVRGQIGGISRSGWAAIGGDVFTQPAGGIPGPAGNLQDILAPAAVARAGKHFAASNH